jgi:hypothetical protein
MNLNWAQLPPSYVDNKVHRFNFMAEATLVPVILAHSRSNFHHSCRNTHRGIAQGPCSDFSASAANARLADMFKEIESFQVR